MKRADGVLPSALLQKGLTELAPAGAKKIKTFLPAACTSAKISHRRAGNPCVGQPAFSVLFALLSLAGDRCACVQKNKNPSKTQGCPMRSSSAGAEMLADKEKPAENTLCIPRALTQYEGISARQNRMFSCLSMASSARKRASVSECAAASRSLFKREPNAVGLV